MLRSTRTASSLPAARSNLLGAGMVASAVRVFTHFALPVFIVQSAAGQYSEHVPDATGLLSTFASSFLEEVASVQLQILTAAVKLFVLRPRQNQQLVTRLLKTATEEVENPDVRDRGAMRATTYAESLGSRNFALQQPCIVREMEICFLMSPIERPGSLEASPSLVQPSFTGGCSPATPRRRGPWSLQPRRRLMERGTIWTTRR